MKFNTRINKLGLNTITSLVYQIVAIICGFILPRQILAHYGSEVNGLVNSITQFLHVITFLELGVGAVVQSALYRPLAQRDNDEISKILVSAQRFFKRIADILLVYVICLTLVYPYVVRENFGWFYTASMIVTLSISSFSQYYFGIVNTLLLNADQRGYVQYIIQMVTIVMNTAVCIVLLELGVGIHAVKLVTSLIYLLRPLYLQYYVGKHYDINRSIQFTGEPIAQKWNGIAQHISAIAIDNTGNIVLTLFSSLANVSIYSVYSLVLYNIKNLLMSLSTNIRARMGELWVKGETERLYDFFGTMEWILHTVVVFIFGCVGSLIVPFVTVYTKGVNDANYAQPVFAALFTLATAAHCLRLPYNMMILAAGHYKQTQRSYIIATCMGLITSVLGVILFDLPGVAMGTLTAMIYQTVWMAIYNSKNLVQWPMKKFVKQLFVDVLTALIAIAATSWIHLRSVDYLSWVIMAVLTSMIWLVVILDVNLVFYRHHIARMVKRKAYQTS